MTRQVQPTLWEAVGIPEPTDAVPPPSKMRRVARVLCYATLSLLAWLAWTYASHSAFEIMAPLWIFAFRGVQRGFGDY
jgi:hypothetical protein